VAAAAPIRNTSGRWPQHSDSVRFLTRRMRF
jgi:hypothetical protein